MILVIDHFDSFVETLARYIRETGYATEVCRVDRYDPSAVDVSRLLGVVLSPGPGRPADTPQTTALFDAAPHLPILGVCLGHQALCEAYGGRTVPAPEPLHGQASLIRHDGDPLFGTVPSPFEAGRYHSLLGEIGDGSPIRPIAWDSGTGAVMAARHRTRPHIGVQFHPESVLTPVGRAIIQNFLRPMEKTPV